MSNSQECGRLELGSNGSLDSFVSGEINRGSGFIHDLIDVSTVSSSTELPSDDDIYGFV